jgi:uncharacterized damage-inducible protein DinB
LIVRTKSCVTVIAVFSLCTLFAPPSTLKAQSLPAKADVPVRLAAPQVPPAQAYAKLLSGQAEEVVSAAEAMPADKYNFAPTTGEFKGVRSFGQQITHIAEAHYYFFGGFGIKPTIDPKAISKLTGKDEIVKALKDSFAFAEKAVGTMTEENAFQKISDRDGTDTRATITAFSLAHTNDHYGQMVEYLRMNGIVPPASRKP